MSSEKKTDRAKKPVTTDVRFVNNDESPRIKIFTMLLILICYFRTIFHQITARETYSQYRKLPILPQNWYS